MPFDKERATENADRIEAEINALSSGYWNVLRRDYKSFWDHAKQVSQMFKSLKPLGRDDRERLWSIFNSHCEEANNQQQTAYAKKKLKSEQHRGYILRQAESARPSSLFGLDPTSAHQMKGLSTILREAGSMLSRHKEEMSGEHKQECFKRIQEIRAVHDSWWADLKGHQVRKQQQFRSRVKDNLEKNIARHRKASNALSRVRAHADKLRNEISSAWSDEYRNRAAGWLSEANDKIRDIENSLQDIEGWIREDEEKL